MAAVDLRVTNGRVVTPNGTLDGGVAADDGRIVSIGSNSSLPEAEEDIDAAGNFVIPGFICPHNHMGLSRFEREYHPQFEHDMETETRSCLVGG